MCVLKTPEASQHPCSHTGRAEADTLPRTLAICCLHSAALSYVFQELSFHYL